MCVCVCVCVCVCGISWCDGRDVQRCPFCSLPSSRQRLPIVGSLIPFPPVSWGHIAERFSILCVLLVVLGTLMCLPRSTYYIEEGGNIAILLMRSSSA